MYFPQFCGKNLNNVLQKGGGRIFKEKVNTPDIYSEKCLNSPPHVWLFIYLHNIKEVVVDLRLVSELELHLVQVGQSVLNLQPLKQDKIIILLDNWIQFLLVFLVVKQ